MKANILNSILKTLFSLSVAFCIWLVIAPIIGMAAGKGLKHGELSSWVCAVGGAGLVSLFVYLVWQGLGTLLGIAAEQERMSASVEALSRRVEELSDRLRSR